MDDEKDLNPDIESLKHDTQQSIDTLNDEVNNLKNQLNALKRQLASIQSENDALIDSANHYKIFIENSRDVMAIVSTKGVFQFVTPNLALLLGYNIGNVVNNSLYNINIYPEDSTQSMSRFHLALTTGKKQTGIEYRTLHKDGRWRWLSTDILPVYDDKGEICSFLVKSQDITERKSVEETLLSTENFYRALIQKAPDGVVLIGPEGTFKYASPAARRIFGFSEDEPILAHPSDFTHPDDLQMVLSALNSIIINPNQVPVLQYRYKHKNGSWLWVESTFSNMFDDQSVNAIVINFRDISERKMAEISLQESTRKLNTTINNLKGVVYRCKNDQNWTMEYISDGILELSGYPAEEFINNAVRSYNDIIHPDDREMVWTETESVQGTQRSFTYEYRIITCDGAIRWVWERGCAIYTGAELVALEGFITDVTERKLSYDALIESEEKYRILVETMSEAVVYVDNDDRIQYVNQRCCELYGYKSEDLIGKLGYDYLIHPDDKEVIIEKNNSRLTGRVDSYEIRARKPSGDVLFLKVSGAPIKDKDGRVIGSVGIMSDITTQKSLEAQLLTSQKMEAIGQLAGGIAHDFNNLLTVILGYSEELLQNLPTENPLFRDVEEIFKAGKRAAGLTQQLLTFSRKQVIQPKVLDLNELIGNLNNMLLRVIGEHIDVISILTDEIPMVKADPGQIEQVIVNLVVNARDAMPEGGKITIETAHVDVDQEYASERLNIKTGSYVMIAVSDTGFGMNKELQKKIFDPFFTTKTVGNGLGLGLSTVYGIVRQSEGYISVYSEPGKGTTIKILLPVTLETPIREHNIIMSNDLMGNGEYILIVEDEDLLCRLVKKVVEGLNYQVKVLMDPGEALELVEGGLKPDLLITDVVMPDMNGKELTDRIRKIIPEQKVLFMSGFTDNAIVHHGVLDPGIPFIQKPFSAAEIAYQINKLLNEPKNPIIKKAHILMLDDDVNIRIFLERASKKRGHSFIGVENPERAIEALSQNRFDVIVVDMNLDGEDGFQALSQIRATGCSTPAIVFTGALSSEDMELLKPLGVVKAMEKSFDNLPLLLYIEELIHKD